MAAVLEIDVGKASLAVALPGPSTTDAIAEALHDAGYAVAIVNPARIAAYASWRA